MSILTTDPKQGWRRFLSGFALFACGLLISLSNLSNQATFQYIGLTLILVGFVIALTGYLPMLWFRLTAAKRNAAKQSAENQAKSFDSSYWKRGDRGR